MQRTIYVKDELWNEIKTEAKKCGIKISELLTKNFKSNSQLDRIERKIDTVVLFGSENDIKRNKQKIQPGVLYTSTPNWKNPLENSSLAPKKE